MPVRALARVNLAAIERNVVRLRVTCTGRSCAQSSRPTATATARCRRPRRRWPAGRELAGRGHRRGGRGSCAAAGIEARVLVMGAISDAGAARRRSGRGADVVAWSEDFVERGGGERAGPVRVHVKLDSGMGRLGTRDAGAGPAPRRAHQRYARARARRGDDPLRHRRRRSRVPGRPAAGVRPVRRGACVAATPASSYTRPTAPPRCAIPPPTSTSCDAGSRSMGLIRCRRIRSCASSSLRSSCTPTGRGQGDRARSECGLRAAVRRHRGNLDRDPADRLRRRSTASASPTTVTCCGRAPVPARGHGEHGQHHDRPGAGDRFRGRDDGHDHRRRRRASARRPRTWPAASPRSTTRSCAASRLACRARITATGCRREARRGWAEPPDPGSARSRPSEAWLVGGAVRDRLLGRETSDYDVAIADDPQTAARALAREAGGHPFRLSDQFGAWRVVAHDHSWQVDLVPLTGARIEDDLRPARFHRQRDRGAAGRRRSDRSVRRTRRSGRITAADGLRARVRG